MVAALTVIESAAPRQRSWVAPHSLLPSLRLKFPSGIADQAFMELTDPTAQRFWRVGRFRT